MNATILDKERQNLQNKKDKAQAIEGKINSINSKYAKKQNETDKLHAIDLSKNVNNSNN